MGVEVDVEVEVTVHVTMKVDVEVEQRGGAVEEPRLVGVEMDMEVKVNVNIEVEGEPRGRLTGGPGGGTDRAYGARAVAIALGSGRVRRSSRPLLCRLFRRGIHSPRPVGQTPSATILQLTSP